MAASPEEIKLNIPWDFIDASKGLAFDIGSSVIKTVYLHKDDWVKPEDRVKDSTGCIRVVRFSKDRLDEAFAHLKDNMHNLRNLPEETLSIYTTGVGSAQFNASIKENLNVENTILDEGSCFHYGFRHLLNNNSRRELLYELHKPSLEAAKKKYAQRRQRVEKIKSKSEILSGDLTQDIFSFFDETEQSDQSLTEDKSLYPCLLLLVGSAYGCLVIHEDGKCTFGDITYRGGRMFLALGSLLTYTKTFDGLMDLCEKGNAAKVSSTMGTVFGVLEKEGGDDLYHSCKEAIEENQQDYSEETMFNFGQAVGKKRGDFKKEDIAMCLLETMAGDAAQIGHNAAEKHKTKHVFFCGSFAAHPVARQALLNEWLKRHQVMAQFNQKVHTCQPHFLKHGPFLGAIGAFINNKLKFRDLKLK